MARSLERSAELVADTNKVQLELAAALKALETLKAGNAASKPTP